MLAFLSIAHVLVPYKVWNACLTVIESSRGVVESSELFTWIYAQVSTHSLTPVHVVVPLV